MGSNTYRVVSVEPPDRSFPINLLASAAAAVPIIALLFQAILWTKYGIDLPFFDDWLGFADGTAGSFALSDLFRPNNDTIHATGRLLDALAIRLLAYNGMVYQLVSLVTCLGLLLFFQHRLLFGSMPVPAAATGFVACIYMLQPYSYWGLQNMAYHQVLPLIALLGSLAIIFSSRVSDTLLAPFIGLVSILGGLAYISGAVVALTSAMAIYLFSTRAEAGVARRLRRGTLGFAVGAACTLPVQLWVILVVQAGRTHDESIPWTWPWNAEFWAFLLGLIGRSIGAQTFSPTIAVSVSSCVAAALVITAVVYICRSYRNDQSLDELRAATVYLTIFCAVGAYSLLIAASRASHGARPGAPLYDWFFRSGGRFHYFWITLLLPWVAAAGTAAMLQTLRRLPGLALCVALALMMLTHAVFTGMFSYSTFFRHWAERREADLNCIQEKLLSGARILCGGPWEKNLTGAVHNARKLDANFTRYLLFRDEISEDVRVVSGRIVHDLGAPILVSIQGAKAVYETGRIQIISVSNDPQLTFRFEGEALDLLRRCTLLRASGKITAQKRDTLQMFAMAPGEATFSENRSAVFHYEADANLRDFDLAIRSKAGFLQHVRIDPGARDQQYQMSDLVFRCTSMSGQ